MNEDNGGGENKPETPPEKSADLLAAEQKLSAAEARLAAFEAAEKAAKDAARSEAQRAAVAKWLAVADDAILNGLLLQVTGLDLAPESLSDAHTKQLGDAVLKLAPSIKSAGRPAGAASTGLIDSAPVHPLFRIERKY